MIKTKSQILLEGRYDSFTRTIVNDVMSFVKETEGDVGEVKEIELPKDSSEYTHEDSGITFPVDLRVYRVDTNISYGDKEISYHVKSYIAEDDYLVIEIIIDETQGKKYYQEIYYKLNEDIRHEIEHYIQQKGFDDIRFKDRSQPLKDTATYTTTYQHHKDPSEIEALVRGFYRRAKLEKLPLDVVMQKDLESDIESGDLSEKEAKDLFSVWLRYAKRHLPNAKYST